MCQKLRFIYPCGHKKVWWIHCEYATEHQRQSRQPCKPSIHHQDPTEKEMKNCCCTDCCQKDLDAKMQEVVAWETIRNNMLNASMAPDPAVQVELDEATQTVLDTTYRHFTQCLYRHNVADGKYVIGNEDRKRLYRPLHDPKPPQIPTRLRINDEIKADYLQRASVWEQYESVIRDRKLFKKYGQLGDVEPTISDEADTDVSNLTAIARKALVIAPPRNVLSKEHLQGIYDSFDTMLQYTYSPRHSDLHFSDLKELLRHFQTVQPLGPNPHHHTFEYVKHMSEFKRFRDQMVTINGWLTNKNTRFPLKEFESWMAEVNDIGELTIAPKIKKLDAWLKDQSPKDQKVVKVLQKDPVAFSEAQERYYASQVRQEQKNRRALRPADYKGSSSTASSSSGSVGDFLDIPSSEEPEPMQIERVRGRSEERGSGQVRPRPGSNDTDISISDRPAVTKKGKGKASGRA